MGDNEKRKIAIIDDDKGLVEIVKEFLESRGFAVVSAYGGKDGVDLVRKERPSLVILDISMADMDGRDVLNALKGDDDTKDIPVIILTGKEEQFSRDTIIGMGAYDYITKPYDSYYLLRQIGNILDKQERGEL